MSFPLRNRLLLHACLMAMLVSSVSTAAVDFEPVRRLRRQGLYRAAERKCFDLLETKLTDSDRAMTLVEYLRTVEAHISTTDSAERANLIAAAQQKVDAYIRTHSASPYGFLVAIQYAIAKSMNAQLMRFDAEASLSTDGFISAITAGRAAIRDFEKLHSQIGDAMRDANNRRPRKGFSEVQFQRLRNTVEWETARAWVNLAQCFPTSKKDRLSVLAQATDLTEPLTRLTANPTIATKARLLDAECRRRIGDTSRAQQLLATMAADRSLSPCVQLSVATQQVWLFTDTKQFASARNTVDRAKSLRCEERQALAEHAYATLNLYIELAIQPGQQDDVWRLRAGQQADLVARQYPGYWQRRSEILHARLRGGSEVASELAQLESQAARAFAAKSFKEAVELYQRAAKIAAEKELRDRVFEFRYRAGAILHQQQQYANASTLLRRAANEDFDQSDANKAHLLAIIDEAQLVASGDAGHIDVYLDMLNEHLSKWPEQPTANQVAFWLGQLRERQRKHADALGAYAQVKTDFKDYRRVIDAVRDCHAEIIASVIEPRQRPDTVRRGVTQLNDIAEMLMPHDDVKSRWATLNAIDLQLLGTSKTASAERKLLQIIADAKTNDDKRAANKGTALLMMSHTAQSRVNAARKLLPELSGISAADARDLMRRLDRVDQQRSQRDLAELQLELFALQDEGDIPGDIRGLYAKSLTKTGRFDDATNELREQLRANPRSIPLRKEFALALQAADKPREALAEWRKLAAGTRPASDEWFQAKYGIAENLLATGDAEKSANVIRVTQALHPSLGGAELKDQFAALLRQCERQ